MTFLFRIEDVFEISGRGCVIVPAIVEGADFKIRPNDAVQLRTPEGRTLNTHIGSVEFLTPEVGMCRMGILLPPEVAETNVPTGTEVWLMQPR
jgi:translation elongation factor EF-Tu-like GTPase